MACAPTFNWQLKQKHLPPKRWLCRWSKNRPRKRHCQAEVLGLTRPGILELRELHTSRCIALSQSHGGLSSKPCKFPGISRVGLSEQRWATRFFSFPNAGTRPIPCVAELEKVRAQCRGLTVKWIMQWATFQLQPFRLRASSSAIWTKAFIKASHLVSHEKLNCCRNCALSSLAATCGKISHISMDLRARTTSLFRIGHVPNKLSRTKVDGGVAGLFGRPETNGLRNLWSWSLSLLSFVVVDEDEDEDDDHVLIWIWHQWRLKESVSYVSVLDVCPNQVAQSMLTKQIVA